MQHIRTTFKRIIIASLALSLFVAPASLPIAVYADAADCVTAPAPKGVDKPTGADSGTYTYNSCGYFENTYYTWSPDTHDDTPKSQPTYTYNQSTKQWDAPMWHYSPARNDWYQSTTSVDQPPAGAPTKGGPVAASAPIQSGATGGSGSGSSIDTSTTNNSTTNDTNNSTLGNTITGTAVSGDASVIGNTNAGSATSGNAQSIANVINLLQSSSTAGANIATFTTNINGDVQGDLTIDPSLIQHTSDSTALNNNVDVNVVNNGSITNNINLAATSGDATVSKNTNAGDATSGNATAMANVVNMMNSMISANQSFLGVININGNLNGNILMPQNFLDQLIASNAPSETVSVSQNTINNLASNVSNNTAIKNNVDSTAVSGSATSDKNTNAGSATSGAASTNVTIFNIANHQVSAGNTMLVFVNVTGKWVGVIMDAPAGSTAAALGGGVNSNTTVANNANANITNNGSITNNIGVTATTGDATVSKNTNAGNATSGSANTAVNISNISNSSINLTGWFGILFINVFGNWTGNFGVATAVPPNGSDSGTNNSAPSAVFGFSAADAATSGAGKAKTTASGANGSSSNTGADFGSTSELTGVVSQVLGATTGNSAKKVAAQVADARSQNMLIIIGGALVLIGVVLAAGDRRFAKSKA